MMKLKDFKLIVFFVLFSVASSLAQYTVSGTITNTLGVKLNSIEVLNKNTGKTSFSNAQGFFEVQLQKAGKHTFVFLSEDYTLEEKTIEIIVNQTALNVVMTPFNKKLNEVVISKNRKKIAGIKQLKDVEGTAIYAGKKTEVVQVSNLVANKSTNNARQIYAQVVGLTINESVDGGLQLSIGGRGLDPNRTSNFNTRQNGYDISADVLGYPESYYATPTEAIEEIQVVRGAASLQYGTQFGGMLNFKLKSPSKKAFEAETRFTTASFGLFSNFTSLSGTKGKFSYSAFANYKKGDGFRPNSNFESQNYFGNLNYKFSENTSLHFDYTHFQYLAKQSGGLTDVMFKQDPTQSNRARNWFAIDWNLFALLFKHKFSNDEFSLQLFGLDASRKALGYRATKVSALDAESNVRDLLIGEFRNWGAEARYLNRYEFLGKKNVFLIGGKYYQSNNSGLQNAGASGTAPNFSIAYDEFPLYSNQSSYKYPNLNYSLFGENIFRINDNFSITPGFRFEYIKTRANGYFRKINLDLSGNVLLDKLENENNVKDRHFVLLGVGLSYKPLNKIEIYGNLSQNYRSVTFNDIRTATQGMAIASDITDEKGFTSDIGIRGKIKEYLTFDLSGFTLYYDKKIGEYQAPDPNGFSSSVRFRDNVGTAITYGVESILDLNLTQTFLPQTSNLTWNVFSNLSITDSKYLQSDVKSIKGNKVEFVPLINLKSGMGFGYKNFLTSFQFTYVSSQFTDASNIKTNPKDDIFGVFGEIPTYYVMDLSTSYKWGMFKLEAGINNITNNWYFTRRATGYPGPGIIPSEPRVVYGTLEFKF
ncbi:TonB-dependent receptor domain-containing protein [Flavobacterium sp.]|uniref:TonB-dependent receptor domain-containing protein n=1 Tax=Flavobacterium sp. TaxID=239 RepID=UPI003D1401F9